MSFTFYIPILTLNLIFFNSPMKLLTFILASVWLFAMGLLETGKTFWVPVLSVMLFNGGLMILFLFIVSMLPKTESKQKSSVYIYSVMLIFFMSNTFLLENNKMLTFYFQSMFLILISVMIMFFYFFGISKLLIDPFKTMKSL